jgi:hypothetical protein
MVPIWGARTTPIGSLRLLIAKKAPVEQNEYVRYGHSPPS